MAGEVYSVKIDGEAFTNGEGNKMAALTSLIECCGRFSLHRRSLGAIRVF